MQLKMPKETFFNHPISFQNSNEFSSTSLEDAALCRPIPSIKWYIKHLEGAKTDRFRLTIFPTKINPSESRIKFQFGFLSIQFAYEATLKA